MREGNKLTPQARGWTPSPCPNRLTPRAYPAGAGMDRDGTLSAGNPQGLPRRRGDGPRWVARAVGADLLTPQARGWTLLLEAPPVDLDAYPAGAGMDLAIQGRFTRYQGLPRRRGDGPIGQAVTELATQLTPQARGWTAASDPETDRHSAYPAGAGMDLSGPLVHHAEECLPRRRGDGPTGWHPPL